MSETNKQFSEEYAYKEILVLGTALGVLLYLGYESGIVIPALKVVLTYIGNFVADLGGTIDMLQGLHAPTEGLEVMMAHANQAGLPESLSPRPEVVAPIQQALLGIIETFK